MKKILPILLFLLFGTATAVIAQDCYNSTRNKGIGLYNQGKKEQAKSYFEAALDCPDKPSNNDLDAWIKKCVEDDRKPVIKTDKITVESVTLHAPSLSAQNLVNVSYYIDELLTLVPKIVVDNGNKKTTKATISISITDPLGNKLMKLSGGRDQYSETKEVSLKHGFNDVFFSSIGTFSEETVEGNYTCEVRVGNKVVKEVNWTVIERPTTLVVNGHSSGFDVPLGCTADSYTFEVITNAVGFEVRHKPSWVTVTERKSDSFTISFVDNPSAQPRDGMMDVYTSNEKRFININLIQDGNPAFARRFGDRMFKDMRMKIGLGLGLPNFSARSNNELGSVIDYGVTDVSTLAYLEVPDYRTLAEFSLAFNVEMPLTKDFYVETGLGLQHFGVKNVFDNTRLKYTVSGTTYHLEYGCVERYIMTYLQIPVLAGYRLRLNTVSSIRFNTGFDLGFGLGAKCKLEGGYSNYTYTEGGYSYYGNSTYNGEVNLYSGKYEIVQRYSTGQHPSYTYSGRKVNPYKRFNLGLHLGAAYDFGSLEVGASYTIGLSNMGNKKYFNSTNRVGGCLFVGEVINSEQGIYNYRQHLNNFQVFVNYRL